MRSFGDLNALIDFARKMAVSINIYYSEASDEMEIEIVSAAETENFSQKRIISVPHFIDLWTKKMNSIQTSSGDSK